MKEPFVRRDENGEPIAFECLMPPCEMLRSKRILLVDNYLFFNFEVADGGIVDSLNETLLCLDAISNDPIKLIISCPGGNLVGAFALYDAIKSVDSPVWTFGHCCWSGAALLLAAGDKGHRYLYPNSLVMLHLPQVTRSSTPVDTKTDEILTKQHTKQRDRMVSLLIECGVNKTPKKILDDIDRVLIMNAEESVKYGLADRVIRGGFLLE